MGPSKISDMANVVYHGSSVIEVTDGCRGDRYLRLVLRRRRLVHAPMLTASHQQRRLEFSYRYGNWASNKRRQVSDRGLPCQEFEPSTTNDLTMKGSDVGSMCRELKRPPVGVVW
ncbi:hypothetical protein TNCV_3767751 [Trichonephila clavipes]|nr:hypothetical protein TNCV_3767751 [Trichonephila clavipes]